MRRSHQKNKKTKFARTRPLASLVSERRATPPSCPLRSPSPSPSTHVQVGWVPPQPHAHTVRGQAHVKGGARRARGGREEDVDVGQGLGPLVDGGAVGQGDGVAVRGGQGGLCGHVLLGAREREREEREVGEETMGRLLLR